MRNRVFSGKPGFFLVHGRRNQVIQKEPGFWQANGASANAHTLGAL
jgi:hypothetical protein